MNKSRKVRIHLSEIDAQACAKYLRREIKTRKEKGAACVYEYAREMVREREIGDYRWGSFWLRSPWSLISILKGFPEIPWIDLKPKDQERFLKGLKDSSTEVVSMGQLNLQMHHLLETFEKFTNAATLGGCKVLPLESPPPSWLEVASIPADQLSGCGEHIVFTIDYRKGKTGVMREFEALLEKRKVLFEKNSRESRGTNIFEDRLRDLAIERIKRSCSGDERTRFIRKYAIEEVWPRNSSSWSESKKRCNRFLSHLKQLAFEDFSMVERSVVRLEKEEADVISKKGKTSA